MADHVARKYDVLCEIWSECGRSSSGSSSDEGAEEEVGNEHDTIAIVSHSFAMGVMFLVLGNEVYKVKEGSLHALLVRGERVAEKPVIEVADLAGY